MPRRWTTRCCSAVALIAISCGPIGAQPATPQPHPAPTPQSTRANGDKAPLAFVPARPVWTLVLGSQLAVPPAFDDGHAYFPLEGDRVVAYTLPSGTRAWMVAARPLMAPTPGDALVFLVDAAGVIALHAADGAVAWRVNLADPPAVRPAYDNGWLIVATRSGKVGALRATDGTIIWQRDLGSPAHAPAALAEDRVYVPVDDGRIVALRVDTGEPVWERRVGGRPGEILPVGERLYVGALDNFFYCLMAKDGRVDWRWRTGGDIVGAAVADDKRAYFTALDNVLRAMDLKSGAQVWVRPLPMRPIAGPLRAGSTIVVAGQAAQLRAFTAKDGTPAPGEPIVPGAAAAGALVISTVYAPGADILRRSLVETDLFATMPTAIPAEVDVNGAGPEAPKLSAIANDADSAAPPHVIDDPATHLPMVLMMTKDIVRGAGVTLVTRSIDPPLAPVAPLPNMVMIAPQTPTTGSGPRP